MTAGELYRWGALDERRRRAARGAAGFLSPEVVAVGAALAVAGVILAMIERGDGGGAVRLALAAIATANVMVVFATPYRMYWRRDSALLGRLPVGGDVLFALAMMRTARATALALLPSAAAALAVLAATGVAEVGLRLGVVALASALMAGLLAPAACLAAGGIVASDKAQAMLDSFGGELRAPKISWLGTLPGLVAFAVAALGVIAAPWVRLESPRVATPLILCAVAGGGSLAAIAWARGAAGRVLLSAQREIAALDQERLAHIDRSQASPLESAWGALTTSGVGRVVYDKDAAMMRRRYPAPYFVGFLGVVATWILAATGEQGTAVVVLFSLAAYALVMARRLGAPPVEHPRLLRTLPLESGRAVRAKRSAALLRALFWCGVAGAALPVFAGDVAVAAVLAAIAVVVAAVGGALVANPR